MQTNRYDTEKQVGKGIKRSGVHRDQIFLATKIWCNSYHPDDVEPALDASLKDLDTDYIDLYLMHYPCTFARGTERFPKDEDGKMIMGETTYLDTWKAMEKLVKFGKAKAIGVSNFNQAEIQNLIDNSDTVNFTLKNLLADIVLIPAFHRHPQHIKWRSILTFNNPNSTPGCNPKAFT